MRLSIYLSCLFAVSLLIFQNCGKFSPSEELQSSNQDTTTEEPLQSKYLYVTSPQRDQRVTGVVEISGVCHSSSMVLIFHQPSRRKYELQCQNNIFSQNIELQGEEGRHNLVIKMDGEKATEIAYSLIKDSVAPSIDVQLPATNATNNPNAVFDVLCEASSRVTLGGDIKDPWKTSFECQSPSMKKEVVFTDGDGIKTLTLSARDSAGNINEVSKQIVIDTQSPALSIVEPAAKAAVGPTFTLTGACEDGLSVKAEGGALKSPQAVDCANQTYALPLAVGDPEGFKNFTLTSTDLAGNEVKISHQVKFVKLIPRPSLLVVDEAFSAKKERTVSLVLDRAINGVKAADFDLVNVSISSIAGSGQNFELNLEFLNFGDGQIKLREGTVVDAQNGFGNAASNSLSLGYYQDIPADQIFLNFVDSNFQTPSSQSEISSIVLNTAQEAYLKVYLSQKLPYDLEAELANDCEGKSRQLLPFKIDRGAKFTQVAIPTPQSQFYFGDRDCRVSIAAVAGNPYRLTKYATITFKETAPVPKVSVAIANPSVQEGGQTAVQFTLSQPVAKDLGFEMNLVNGDGPIQLSNGKITMGQTEVTLNLQAAADDYYEVNESVTLEFKTTDSQISIDSGSRQKIVEILNTTPAPMVSLNIEEVKHFEGRLPHVTISLRGKTRVDPMVRISSNDGSATGGSCSTGADFESFTNRLVPLNYDRTQANNPVAGTLTWQPCQDQLFEPEENFFVYFSGSQHVQESTQTLRVNLVDDDSDGMGATSILAPTFEHYLQPQSGRVPRMLDQATVIAADALSFIVTPADLVSDQWVTGSPVLTEYEYSGESYKVARDIEWTHNASFQTSTSLYQGFKKGNHFLVLFTPDGQGPGAAGFVSFYKSSGKWVAKNAVQLSDSSCNQATLTENYFIVRCETKIVMHRYLNNLWQENQSINVVGASSYPPVSDSKYFAYNEQGSIKVYERRGALWYPEETITPQLADVTHSSDDCWPAMSSDFLISSCHIKDSSGGIVENHVIVHERRLNGWRQLSAQALDLEPIDGIFENHFIILGHNDKTSAISDLRGIWGSENDQVFEVQVTGQIVQKASVRTPLRFESVSNLKYDSPFFLGNKAVFPGGQIIRFKNL